MIAILNCARNRKFYGLLTLSAWLPFADIVSSNTAVGQQDATAKQPSVAADTTASPQHISMARIQSMVTDLDAFFIKGDIESYLNAFMPDQDGSLAMLGIHLENLAAISGKSRQRESTIIGGPMIFESRTVVRVRHITTWTAPFQRGRHVEDTYLAVGANENGKIVPTFAIEVPPSIGCVKDAKLHCPPCNYQIGGVAGFLCVPLPREKSLALESTSFYLIGTDIVCDVVVQIESKPLKAKAVAQRLAGAFARIEPSARIGIPSDWTPPRHKKLTPYGMDSARIEVELPIDHKESGGDVSIFHVVSFGGVQHLLLVRASKKSLNDHRASIDKLLKSYMLLDVEDKGASLAAKTLRQHTGGQIKGNRYQNERFDLQLQGPKGWRAQDRVGGSMFRVRWTRNQASEMWLIGHRVPAGMDEWSLETAERWLSHHRKRLQLVEAKGHGNAKEANWHQAADGSTCRTLTLIQQRGGDGTDHPAHPTRRLLHMRLHDDLLVLVDGYGVTEADEAAVRSAIRTLKRMK